MYYKNFTYGITNHKKFIDRVKGVSKCLLNAIPKYDQQDATLYSFLFL